jgi:hypothetical protein
VLVPAEVLDEGMPDDDDPLNGSVGAQAVPGVGPTLAAIFVAEIGEQ